MRFHYGKAGGVIDDLSFSIAPGEKVGLVGRSGAGKSTLVNLLLRFYHVEGGRILIDGQDIASTTQDSLRQQIGMVTQDTSLLHRSIGENIRYGRPDATDEAMIAAARQAHAHDFVMGLIDPDGRKGYDTLVGERGVKLSVVAHELPDVFLRVEFRAFRPQRDQGDVGRHDEPARQMPAGLIDEEGGVRAGRNLGGDFGQVQVHGFGVASGHDEGCALAVLRAKASTSASTAP